MQLQADKTYIFFISKHPCSKHSYLSIITLTHAKNSILQNRMRPQWFLIKKFLLPQNQNIWEETKKDIRKPWHGILSLILCTILVPLHHRIQFLISCLHLIVDNTLKPKKLNTVLNKQLKWWIINTKHPTHNSTLFSSSKLLRTYTTHSVKKISFVLWI